MKRPHLVHIIAVKNESFINIRASIILKYPKEDQLLPTDDKRVSAPLEAISFLRSNHFKLQVVLLNESSQEIFAKSYESDPFGNFNIKIGIDKKTSSTKAINLFEVGTLLGVEFLVGTVIPIEVKSPLKIVISDFDKTLVDTKYATTKEVYRSLTKPISEFPTVFKSVQIIKGFMSEGFHPFILSASPHFYENAIRDWLYQNEIYTAGIFLKDYRKVLSFIEDELGSKDLKIQAPYKLNHLLNILLMSGIPDELVLIGDNYETDALIYLTLSSILIDEINPWSLWNLVRKKECFELNRKQNTNLLNKLYQLKSLLSVHRSKGRDIQIKIYIRKKSAIDSLDIPIEFLRKKSEMIELYD